MQATQEIGVPITTDEQEKLFLLADMEVLDLHEWLNPYDYPTNRTEARAKFKERFSFYDLLSLDKDMLMGQQSSLSLIKINVLWREFMDFCACPPRVLLDKSKYSDNLEVAKFELEQRIMVWDCYKGNLGIYGPPRHGKSGYMAVHSWHGKEWFNLPVVCYRFRYNDEAYGDYVYLNEHKMMEVVGNVSEIVEKKNKQYFQWIGKTREEADKVKQDVAEKLNLKNVFLVVDEAHKTVGKDHRTLLSFFFEDITQEWGHYRIGIAYITHDLDLLSRDRIQPYLNIKVGVSRNMDMPNTSNVRIKHMETGEDKPVIYFCREDYYPLWSHNAPIASRSLVTSKDIRKMVKEQKEEQEVENGNRSREHSEQEAEDTGGIDANR